MTLLRRRPDELRELREWKAAATSQLHDWERCHDLLAAHGHGGVTGDSRAEQVRRYVARCLVGEESARQYG
jgi:hypothetical protein